MTIKEAVERGVFAVRKPEWVTGARLKLYDAGDGGIGPWAELYDEPTQKIIGEPTPQSVLILGDTSEDWEKA